jgi:hypothetical protein
MANRTPAPLPLSTPNEPHTPSQGLLAGVTPDMMRAAHGPISRMNPMAALMPTAYGRGQGFTDPQWRRFDQAQIKAAEMNDATASQLRAAAAGMAGGGNLTKSDIQTLQRFEKVMGQGLASYDNLLQTADRLDAASVALRDKQAYFARAYPPEHLKRPDETLMGVPNHGKELWVNLKHPEATVMSKLRWALGHEPLHSDRVGIEDQKGSNGASAYRFGEQPNRDAYAELSRQKKGKTLDNPDHITAFAQGKWR